MTVKRINHAIRHTGLEIVRGDGYQYFLDWEGDQVGDAVMVCYLNQMSLERWVEQAEETAHHCERHRPKWDRHWSWA
tara:strand:- start:5101 stop:5331 length:231 start_codon:yes stop_codon:yes gene_type:complete